MSRARSVADLGNQNVLTVSATDGNINVGTGVTIENTGEAQFSGIVTAQSIDTRNLIGDVSVGGVLTYEDVTSVDSVGIITARNGLRVTEGGLVVTAGVSTFVGLSTFNNGLIVVSGVSTLGNTVIGGGTTELVVTGDARVTGILTVGTSSFTINGAHEYPTIRPTLDLNFAATKTLDRRITFTRDGVGTFTDDMGIVRYASNNVPRFDHDVTTGESLGLLIEESRTNQFSYSSDFTQSLWVGANISVTADQIVAPDDTTTADKILALSTAAQDRYIRDERDITSGVTYTQSVFVKAGEVTVLQITPSTGFASRYQNFNLSTGQLGSGDVDGATITAYPNGWYRCTVTQTATLTTAAGRMLFAFASSPTSDRLHNPVFNLGDGLYLWGAQLEAGDFASSYIPTNGTTVTRGDDLAKITGTNFTDFHNATEGTLYGEYKATLVDNAPYLVMLSDGTNNNRTIINTDYSAYQGVVKYSDGTNQAVLDGGTPTLGGNNKTALTFKKDDFALSLNGGTVATDTSGNVSVNNMMSIGSRHGADGFVNSTIKDIKYYNKRLPNAQLQGLTS